MTPPLSLTLAPKAVALLGRLAAAQEGSSVGLALSASGLEVRTRVRGVPVALTLALSAWDANVEIDVTKASAAGWGLFGAVRRMANAALIARAASYPQVSLRPNERGNLTLSIPGLAFGSVSLDADGATFALRP